MLALALARRKWVEEEEEEEEGSVLHFGGEVGRGCNMHDAVCGQEDEAISSIYLREFIL